MCGLQDQGKDVGHGARIRVRMWDTRAQVVLKAPKGRDVDLQDRRAWMWQPGSGEGCGSAGFESIKGRRNVRLIHACIASLEANIGKLRSKAEED